VSAGAGEQRVVGDVHRARERLLVDGEVVVERQGLPVAGGVSREPHREFLIALVVPAERYVRSITVSET